MESGQVGQRRGAPSARITGRMNPPARVTARQIRFREKREKSRTRESFEESRGDLHVGFSHVRVPRAIIERAYNRLEISRRVLLDFVRSLTRFSSPIRRPAVRKLM